MTKLKAGDKVKIVNYCGTKESKEKYEGKIGKINFINNGKSEYSVDVQFETLGSWAFSPDEVMGAQTLKDLIK